MSRESSILKEGVHFKKYPFNRKCHSCQKIFDNPLKFLTHVTCYKKTEFYKKTKDGSESWGCMECPKKFSNPSALSQHVAYHHAEKTLECLICHDMFSSPSRLRYHKCCLHLQFDTSVPKVINSKKYVEGVHYKRHPFLKKCEDCRQSFADPVAYISHEKCTKPRLYFQKNEVTEKYRCEWPGCGKEVTSLNRKKFHFASHAEKTIECLVCRKRFGHLTAFCGHFSIGHKTTEEPERRAKKTDFEKCISLSRAIAMLNRPT